MNNINKLLSQILEELKKHLNHQEYAHLIDIKNNVVIYCIDDTIDTIDMNNEYISSMHIQPYSQIIDIAPINDHYIKPILLIREDATTTQIIHEICRLLSIGLYQNNHHSLGINEYFDDKKYEHYYLNEWMNDIITSYFMKLLFHEEFHYREMDKLKAYICVDMHQLLIWYFGGHVRHIRNMLGDYDVLYKKIV